MSCRLLLVDDHEVVRKNLREIIEFKTDCVIVGEAVDGLQAVVLATFRRKNRRFELLHFPIQLG